MSAHIGEASPLSLLGPLVSVYGRDDLVDDTIVCPGPLRLVAKHPEAAALIMKRILVDSRFYAVVGYPKADTHLGWGPHDAEFMEVWSAMAGIPWTVKMVTEASAEKPQQWLIEACQLSDLPGVLSPQGYPLAIWQGRTLLGVS